MRQHPESQSHQEQSERQFHIARYTLGSRAVEQSMTATSIEELSESLDEARNILTWHYENGTRQASVDEALLGDSILSPPLKRMIPPFARDSLVLRLTKKGRQRR
jgi:hypothetical protein